MIKKYCLFIIYLFFILIDFVYAESYTNTASSSTGDLYPDADPCTQAICCSKPFVNLGAVNVFSVNVYDLNGKLLSTDSSFINNSKLKFAAGTPIILDVREDAILMGATYSESKAIYNPDSNYLTDPLPEITQADHNFCKNKYPIKKEAIDLGLTINTGVHKITYYDEDYNSFVIDAPFNSIAVSDGMKGNWKVSYNIPRTCMNRKTGKVTYILDASQPCQDEEIDVNALFGVSDKTVYFIPLKVKSTNYFGIKIETLDDVDSLMTNWTFNGVTSWNYRIPVKQNFYHEVKEDNNKIKFKGYEFFTRQINPKNPFPNGINECSYWDSKKSGDYIDTAIKSLGSSFTNLNYSFKVGNVSQATLDANRNYNDEHLYTDWSDMNINGWSNNLIHGSDVKTGSTYALGCGPALKKYKNFDEVCDIK